MRLFVSIWQATYRIVLAIAIVASALLAVRFGVLPVVFDIFKVADASASLIRHLAMIVTISGAYGLAVWLIERRSPNELRFDGKAISLSGILGASSLLMPVAALWSLGYLRVDQVSMGQNLMSIALVIFGAALLEEVIFRAIIFRFLKQYVGLITALALPSVLFSLLHFFNSNVGGWTSFISVALLGILWSLVYLITQNVWATALNHAAWNFSIVLSGLPLTGQEDWRGAAPLQTEAVGPTLWTGGDMGPENSILVIFVVGVVIAGLTLLVRHQSRKTASAD